MAYKLLLFFMFQIIRTGIDASNRDLAIISNNIANAGTNGFKRSEAQFEDVYRSQHNDSTEKARGIGVKTIKPRQNFSQGSLQQTNGSLDLAIMGEGFFVLGTPVGREVGDQSLSFTRDGSFQLDRLGNLVTTDGLPLLGEGQTLINIPFKSATGYLDIETLQLKYDSQHESLNKYAKSFLPLSSLDLNSAINLDTSGFIAVSYTHLTLPTIYSV